MTKSYLIISVFILSILSCQENRKIKHSGFDDLVVGSETINLFQNGEFSIEVGLGYQEGTYIIKGDTVHLAYNQKVNLPQKFILDDNQFKSIDFSREITISRTDRSQIESIPKKNIKVFDLKNEFKIKEIIKSNDYPSCEKDTTMCNDWILTKQDIKLIIKNAQPINGPEWHHLFNHFPCRIHGKLVQGANEYEYSINSGAWFRVNSIDTTLMFGSFKEENKKFFLSTALTEDENSTNSINMKQLLFLLTLVLTICLQGNCQKRFITIDSTKIWVNTAGIEHRKEGQPVVIFESGRGTPMGNWDKVLAGTSELAPIVTYDRPGIGDSEPVDEMPTIKNVADRVVKILEYLKLDPPYLLVGHSLGGVYVRGFAVYYPEMLAGLVIIDPGDFTENKKNIHDHYDVLDWEDSKVDSLIQAFIDIRKKRNEESPVSIQREGQVLEDLRETEFKIINENPLPNIPVHIITGGRFDMPEKFPSTDYDDEALFRSKTKHRVSRWTDVIQSVDKGMLFYSGDAGHFVQWDDPELVISSIKIALLDYDQMTKGK